MESGLLPQTSPVHKKINQYQYSLISADPLRCPPGSFQNMTGQVDCMLCPAGYYCVDGLEPRRCPRGGYCPGNTTADIPLCPRGTFNDQYGM